MPPMMPFIQDALWFGVFAGLALFAWKAAQRFDLRLSTPDLRWPFGQAVAAATPAWLTTTPARTTARSSGNTAFDEWRDGEIARIEAQRHALETRLQAFEGFVDNLKHAKDRKTFERFMTQFRNRPESGADAGRAVPGAE